MADGQMGETHVVTALKAKRAEISGYVHDLEAQAGPLSGQPRGHRRDHPGIFTGD